MFLRRNITGRVQYVGRVTSDEGSGTVAANLIDIDQLMIERRSDAGFTPIELVETFRVTRGIANN